jgi:hypothetical protein
MLMGMMVVRATTEGLLSPGTMVLPVVVALGRLGKVTTVVRLADMVVMESSTRNLQPWGGLPRDGSAGAVEASAITEAARVVLAVGEQEEKNLLLVRQLRGLPTPEAEAEALGTMLADTAVREAVQAS